MALSSPPLPVPPSALNKGPYPSQDCMPSSPTSNNSTSTSSQASPRVEAPQLSIQQNSLLSVAFNQDHGCFSCGTQTGFRVYNCDPFKEAFFKDLDGAGISIVEMLFRFDTTPVVNGLHILALVGGGKSPRYSPNKVMIWDHHLSRCIGELSFRSEVRAVRLRKDKIVVVLEFKIYVYNFADLKLLHQIETWSNSKGICALSPAPKSCVLACPGQQKGEVRVELYSSRRTKFIQAHDSSLACLSLSLDGSLLATASNKGTLVRIFNTADGTKLQELRRGAEHAEIYSLAFHPNLRWLAVSSAKGTVHVFTVKPTTKEAQTEAITNASSPSASGSALSPSKINDSPSKGSSSSLLSSASANAGSSLSFMKGVLPKYFSSEWSFAQFRVREEAKAIVAFGTQKDTIVIVCTNGSFYRCSFDGKKGGEMVQLEYERFMKPEKGDEETVPT